MKIIPAVGIVALVAILPVAVQGREFTDSNGNIIDAELVSHKGGKVTILRKDGKKLEVAPTVFSSRHEIHHWLDAENPRAYKLQFRDLRGKEEDLRHQHQPGLQAHQERHVGL